MKKPRCSPLVRGLRYVCPMALAIVASLTAAAQDITIQAPSLANQYVAYPSFYLEALSTTCESAATTQMGYSINYGSTTGPVTTYSGAQSIQEMVTPPAGATNPITVNVYCWNGSGQKNSTSLAVNTAEGDGVTITSPGFGNTTYGSMNLQAKAPSCAGGTTSSIGYSFNSSSDTTTVNGSTLNVQVSGPGNTGWNILRVKAWVSGSDAYCESDLPFNVPPAGGLVPSSTAQQVSVLETDANYSGSGSTTALWQQESGGTSEGASGSTSIGYGPTFPTWGGNPNPAEFSSREFTLNPDGTGGGLLWFDAATTDVANDSATNFQYDLWVYFPTAADVNNLGNLELDTNHAVTTDAKLTYIMAVQCWITNSPSEGDGVWQTSPNGSSWQTSNATCSRSEFSAGAWHHVQIQNQHEAEPGTGITYGSVSVDEGTPQALTCGSEACTGTAQSLGWGSVIGPNFQLDGGNGTGTVHAYVDAMSVFYWP